MSEETGQPEPYRAPPPPEPPPPRPLWAFFGEYRAWLADWFRAYFLDEDPGFWSAFAIFALVSILLYSRWFTTNFIFDEQEALLANPYVNNAGGKLRFIDAIHRDFWGLLPDRSIGSYRPVPNFLWRAIWQLSSAREGVFRQAFVHHILNVVLHGANAALMTVVTFAWTRRRGMAWIAGIIFAASAILTEAVSGVVGLADVLGGMGALLALWALSAPAYAMPFAVFTAVAFGLFSKESALVCVPLVPFVALLAAPLVHPKQPARFARAALAFVAAAAAFYLYVELRKKWFPSPLPRELAEELPDDATWVKRTAHDFLVWFHQAPLPRDPLNNPLADADTPHRVAGALRVYFRGLVQVVFPYPLSGDYSFPQEPVPDKLVFPASVAGALGIVLPPLASFGAWLLALTRERRLRAEAAALSPGAQGDLLGDVMRGAGVLLLCIVPAFAVRALARGHGDEVLPEGPLGAALLYGAPLVAALLWAASALRLHLRRRGSPERGSAPLRVAGLAFILAALALVVDLFVLRPQGAALAFRGIPYWVASIPALVLGIGLLVEGLPSLADPFATRPERPLGMTGLLMTAAGITWVVVSYFPHSNIPVVLPTVRAERFWYFPVLGSTLALTAFFAWAGDLELRRFPAPAAKRVIPWLLGAFLSFQALSAYRHAMDYRSDVDFWRATKDAVPRSAKAHLNYSVMKGARGDLETRLVESKIAMQLAPKWAMAWIYTGDTLCRLHRAPEAWEFYAQGFAKGPNDSSLIALALQCLYDEKHLLEHGDELRSLSTDHEGSWLAYLALDTLNNHEKHKGVDPKYRPRAYNDGPKGD
jgi:hypothetical protein